MNINLLSFFQVNTQLKLLSQIPESSEANELISKLSEQLNNTISQGKNFKKLLENKLSSILDLIENSKNNQGYLVANISKKIIQETDFDSFLTYLNYLCLEKENYQSACDLINSIISLLDNKNSKENLTDYSPIRITCLFYKLNIDFLYSTENKKSLINDSLKLIREEIEYIESYFTEHLSDIGLDSIESPTTNTNSILNQLPLLKSYLLHWSLLLFGSDSKLHTIDFTYIDNFLNLALNKEYFGYLINFDYLIEYVCLFYVISKKDSYKGKIIELASNNNSLISCKLINNLYGEFDIDLLLSQRKSIIAKLQNDNFLSKFKSEIEIHSSELIISLYISLYNNIEVEKLSKELKLRNTNITEYIKLLIKTKYAGVVFEEYSDEFIKYRIEPSKALDDYKIRNKVVSNITKILENHLN